MLEKKEIKRRLKKLNSELQKEARLEEKTRERRSNSFNYFEKMLRDIAEDYNLSVEKSETPQYTFISINVPEATWKELGYFRPEFAPKCLFSFHFYFVSKGDPNKGRFYETNILKQKTEIETHKDHVEHLKKILDNDEQKYYLKENTKRVNGYQSVEKYDVINRKIVEYIPPEKYGLEQYVFEIKYNGIEQEYVDLDDINNISLVLKEIEQHLAFYVCD